MLTREHCPTGGHAVASGRVDRAVGIEDTTLTKCRLLRPSRRAGASRGVGGSAVIRRLKY